MDTVVTKQSKYSESCCLINICYILNTYLIIISNLVLYWAGNNILSGVDLIQLGMNLQYIPICFRIKLNDAKIQDINKKLIPSTRLSYKEDLCEAKKAPNNFSSFFV